MFSNRGTKKLHLHVNAEEISELLITRSLFTEDTNILAIKKIFNFCDQKLQTFTKPKIL